MKLLLMATIQWLHVLAGLVWVGGQVFIAFLLWPALLRQPAEEARALYGALARTAGGLLGTTGALVLALGVLRGTWLGPIRSWSALVDTAYGRTFALALLLTIGVMAHGDSVRAQLERRVWAGTTFHPEAARFLRRNGAITLTGLAAIVACMVLMRFGL